MRVVTDIYNSRIECEVRRMLHKLLKYPYLCVRLYAVVLGDIRERGG